MIVNIKLQAFFLGVITLINIGCSGQVNKDTAEKWVKTKKKKIEQKPIIKDSIIGLKGLKFKSDLSKSYQSIKESIKAEKLKLIKKKVGIDSIASIFKRSLLNRIIPFWAGTTWSFEGHTSIPNKGEIACGYFVSTTLKHMDVNINRYKLAQQSPINEARSLALKNNVLEVEEGSLKGNILKIKESIKEGIHFIGFDQSHVGYILKEKGELYLIHSNYMNAKGVEIERIEASEVFASYEKFYIVEISKNEDFLKNWVAGKEIKIITTP